MVVSKRNLIFWPQICVILLGIFQEHIPRIVLVDFYRLRDARSQGFQYLE